LTSRKLEIDGGPVFSLINEAKRKDEKKTTPMVYCGLAAKEIAGWEIGRPELDQKVGLLVDGPQDGGPAANGNDPCTPNAGLRRQRHLHRIPKVCKLTYR
jgi:hypothetical protein